MPKIKIKTATSTESTPVDSVVSVPIDNFYIGDSPVTDLYLNEKEYLTVYKGDTLKTTINIQMAYTTLTEPNKVQIKTIKKLQKSTYSYYELDKEFKQTLFSCSLYGKPIDRLSDLFYNCSNMKFLDLDSLDTSKVTNMGNLFSTCPSLTNLDLSNFNTFNVKSFAFMFLGCSSLTSLDLSSFNTSNVNWTHCMFAGCSSLTNLNVSSFNTSNVKSMELMFGGCSSLTHLDVSNFNTSNVTNIGQLFNGCSSLTNLDLSNFNTSNVTTMELMFKDCSSLTNLNLSNFNTSKVVNTTEMFNGCTKLETIYSDHNLDFSKVTKSSNMFLNCTSLSGNCKLSYDSSKVDVTYACIVGENGVSGYFTYLNSEKDLESGVVGNKSGWYSYSNRKGPQYIDTGITASSKVKVIFRAKFATRTGGSIIGAYGVTPESKAFRFFNANGEFYLDYGSGSGYNRIHGGTYSLATDYTVEFGNRYVKAYNNTSKTDLGTVASGTAVSAFNYTDLPIHITHDTEINGEFYFVQIYVDDVLVRNLIPVTWESGFYTGMFDLVNNELYYSYVLSGSGE